MMVVTNGITPNAIMPPFIDHAWFSQMDATTFISLTDFKMPSQPSNSPDVDSGCSNLLGRILVMGLPWGDPAVSSPQVLQGLRDGADSLIEEGSPGRTN